jgi:hypothetical protein
MMQARTFTALLLAFWAAWFTIVFLTNAFSALKAAGRVGPGWKFASKNYESVVKAVSLYSAPSWLPRLLFAGVLAWQLAAAVLYAAASAGCLSSASIPIGLANLAFATGAGLCAAFMLADEITIKYAYEQAHELLLIAQLASLAAIHALGGWRIPA